MMNLKFQWHMRINILLTWQHSYQRPQNHQRSRISIYAFQSCAWFSKKWRQTNTDEGASGLYSTARNRHMLPGMYFKIAWNREG